MTIIELLEHQFLDIDVLIKKEFFNNITHKSDFKEYSGNVECVFSEWDEYHADGIYFIIEGETINIKPKDQIITL